MLSTLKSGFCAALLFGLPACTTLDAEMIKALAADSASFCARSGVSGGAGGVIGGATGGYGQADFAFCRSNHDGAVVTLKADGSMSIEHK
mgnify:CR=1 FL=1